MVGRLSWGLLQARIAKFAAALAALALLGLYATAPASAQVSFTRAWGWGVGDGASHFETCTSSCQAGIAGGGAGQLDGPPGGAMGVATDSSGDVYVADAGNNRVDEFSAAGALIEAYGWGVGDGASHFETCTSSCQAGIAGGGAGQLDVPADVAIDSSGDVYVADEANNRVDEFSATGSFIKSYGWGVADGANHFETCTTTCQAGLGGPQLDFPSGVAIDSSGDVYVVGSFYAQISEFSAGGSFIKSYGWGVVNGANQFETCTSFCRGAGGIPGGGAGQFKRPYSVATDSSGDVFVSDGGNERIDEFSADGSFIEAYGWGVSDGASQFETCTSTCQTGIAGGGAGQLDGPEGVATDSSGNLYVAGFLNERIDEFSAAGSFIEAYGWGISDGASHFETCTTTCQTGLEGGGAGQLDVPSGVAIDGSGDVYVADQYNNRIDEFRTGAIPGRTSPCKRHQLVISLGRLSALSGRVALPIRFRDRGGACSLRGFPTVHGLSVRGRVIIRAKRALKGFFGQWRVTTVALKNGETASALLEGVDPAFLSHPPRSSDRFRITPPHVSNGVRRRTSFPLCLLLIHPVVVGRNGGGR